MAYNSGGVANALVTVLEGLDGMGNVQIGAPESMSTRVSSFVTLGSHQSQRKTSGTMQRLTRFFVMFAYRVDGSEATAETTLMSLVDDFINAIDNDKTLGGVVFDANAESQAADEPEYQSRAGKEFREYPVIVTVTQRGTYAVNPS